MPTRKEPEAAEPQATEPEQLSIYDDPRVAPKQDYSDDVKFAQVGDHVRGVIHNMEIIDTKYGPCAKYWLYDVDNETERTMLAGAVDLWRKLHALRPQNGDCVDIKLVAIEGQRHVYTVTSVTDEPF